MQLLTFSYSLSRNIGDELQSIAAAGCLPHVDGSVDRDYLKEYSGPPAAVVMNGWFSSRPESWPPASNLHPIFVGFHMAGLAEESYAPWADYFRKFQPIGCRDPLTTEVLQGWGVDAYTSYCSTLTLKRRAKAPANGKVALVDAGDIYVPGSIRRGSVRISHIVESWLDHKTKMAYAHALLEFYRNEVSLVVTTRLHCALPCAAMGIPVVFFGDPRESRTAITRDVGIPIYESRRYRRGASGLLGRWAKDVDWSPPPVDASRFSKEIREAIASRLDVL